VELAGFTYKWGEMREELNIDVDNLYGEPASFQAYALYKLVTNCVRDRKHEIPYGLSKMVDELYVRARNRTTVESALSGSDKEDYLMELRSFDPRELKPQPKRNLRRQRGWII
jgi:hypothetical protein